MNRIFLSYRRSDSAVITGRIYDRLTARPAFGVRRVFKDVDDIPFGVDFRKYIDDAVEVHDAVLVIIGPGWLNATSERGDRRLDDPQDFVRVEVGSALKRGNLVVPVLVGGAIMPTEDELPPDLRDLVFRNAIEVRNDPDFHRDMDRLIANLKQSLGDHARAHGKGLARSGMLIGGVALLLVIAALVIWALATRGGDDDDSGDAPLPTAAAQESAGGDLLPTSTAPPTSIPAAVTETPTVTLTLAPTHTPAPTAPPDAPFPAGTAPEWTPVIQEVSGIPFVYVPAGCFTLGDQMWYPDERPAREVCMSAFWIAQTEITNADYALCVAADICPAPSVLGPDVQHFGEAEYIDHPVIGVNWYNALTFANWLGGTLPTEAQWEYAARGPASLMYPWGDEFNEQWANWVIPDDGFETLAPVGSYPQGASWVGALDMVGNAGEWTLSWYDDTTYSLLQNGAQDPAGPTAGDARVWRGGSYTSTQDYARGAARQFDTPDNAAASRGFRVMLPAEDGKVGDLRDTPAASVECPAALPAQVQGGDQAVILRNDGITTNINLRYTAGTRGIILGVVPSDYVVTIIGGPQCADDYLWWFVETPNHYLGWIAEGDAEEYFMAPVEP